MKTKSTQIKSQLSLLAVMSLMLAIIAPAEARDYPNVTEEGLVRVKDTQMEAVYVMEGADFSGYYQVWLDDASVEFRKNWQRDQNRNVRSTSGKVKDSDMEKIKAELASMFDEVFSEELTKGGYGLTEKAGQGVLRIRPAIVDLDVTAPDIKTASNVSSYSESAGEMTLVLELYDSESGALIAKGLDTKKDHRRGYHQWRTSVSNRNDAKRALTDWAKILRTGLDEAKASSG